jgi:hypothetical protein
VDTAIREGRLSTAQQGRGLGRRRAEKLTSFVKVIFVEQNTSPLNPLSVHGEGRLSEAQRGEVLDGEVQRAK